MMPRNPILINTYLDPSQENGPLILLFSALAILNFTLDKQSTVVFSLLLVYKAPISIRVSQPY